jgi:hypothetical protein
VSSAEPSHCRGRAPCIGLPTNAGEFLTQTRAKNSSAHCCPRGPQWRAKFILELPAAHAAHSGTASTYRAARPQHGSPSGPPSASTVFDAIEEALDEVSLLVECLFEGMTMDPAALVGNIGDGALRFDLCANPVVAHHDGAPAGTTVRRPRLTRSSRAPRLSCTCPAVSISRTGGPTASTTA